jgi:hypothetical protein
VLKPTRPLRATFVEAKSQNGGVRAGLILHWKRKSSSDASVKPGSSRLADCHRVLRQEGEWPQDLRKYKTSEEAAAYLLDSVCELDLGGSLGAMQWYSVRLE